MAARHGSGFTVTKKVGNAVVRNRTRRRLEGGGPACCSRAGRYADVDLVVIGRDGTRGAAVFPALMDDLRRALDKVGVA